MESGRDPRFEQERRPHGTGRSLALAAAFSVAYLLLDWLSFLHPLKPFLVTPWNPQPAVAIALLVYCGQRWLPVVFATAIAAEVLLRPMPANWVATLAAPAVLALSYAGIAHALTHTLPVRARLDGRRDVMRLIVVVTLGALVTGALYLAALLAGGVGTAADLPGALIDFWIGESVGVLVTLPLLLMLTDAERRRQCRAMLRLPETAAQAFATATALWFVFGRHALDHFKFFYVLFLPLVWASARHGMMGAALAAIAIQTGVMIGVYVAGFQALNVFELQELLIALTITGFFLGVTVDERERAAAELRQSLKLAAAAEMAAALAHELNQPLAALTSYARASRLLAEGDGERRVQLMDTLEKLGVEARRAADVVRRLRDFFRSGSRKSERVSLPELVGNVVDSLAARAAAGGIAVRTEAPGHLPAISADPLQLELVLRNLLVNAYDAVSGMPEGRREVVIELSGEGGRAVHVRVLDSGPGIPAAHAERLFEAFVTSKATGMGVGLALSRAVVEAHGGELRAVTGRPGGEVSFTLPARDEADA